MVHTFTLLSSSASIGFASLLSPHLVQSEHPRHDPIKQSPPGPASRHKPDEPGPIPFPDPRLTTPRPRPKPSPGSRAVKDLVHNATRIGCVWHGVLLAVNQSPLVLGFNGRIQRVRNEGALRARNTGLNASCNDRGHLNAAVASCQI